MPTPPSPSPKTEVDSDEIRENEVSRAIKHSKSSSTPSPFDQVSYLIFKGCPALQTALLDLFNTCWSQSVIPTQWKMAAIKLIAKPSAMDKPTSPSSFRPTALTSCIGKLFSTILRNRWIDYMIDNRFLDHSIQKVFMSATSRHNPALIQLSVEHYHTPLCFRQILQALYSDLIGKVITKEWETPPIPLDIGVCIVL